MSIQFNTRYIEAEKWQDQAVGWTEDALDWRDTCNVYNMVVKNSMMVQGWMRYLLKCKLGNQTV